MDNWKDYKAVFAILATPATLWLLLFFLVPLTGLYVLSISDKAVVNGQVSINDYTYFTGIGNYLRAYEPIYMQVMWRTIWISGIATFISLLMAYPIAFGICFAPDRWRPILLMLVVLPFWINLLIRTYSLIAVFRNSGYINQTLGLVSDWTGGFISIGPFENMLGNDAAIIFGLVYVYMPFMVLPLYSTIERLDRSYLEASLDLGASQFKTFWKITLPLTMPGVITGIILVFIPCLGSFLTPNLLGGANSLMIGNVIENQFKGANDWPFGSALSFILMFATFVALMIRALMARRSAGADA